MSKKKYSIGQAIKTQIGDRVIIDEIYSINMTAEGVYYATESFIVKDSEVICSYTKNRTYKPRSAKSREMRIIIDEHLS